MLLQSEMSEATTHQSLAQQKENDKAPFPPRQLSKNPSVIVQAHENT